MKPIFDIESSWDRRRVQKNLRGNSAQSRDSMDMLNNSVDMLIKEEFEYQLDSLDKMDGRNPKRNDNSALLVSDSIISEEMRP